MGCSLPRPSHVPVIHISSPGVVSGGSVSVSRRAALNSPTARFSASKCACCLTVHFLMPAQRFLVKLHVNAACRALRVTIFVPSLIEQIGGEAHIKCETATFVSTDFLEQ